MMTKLLLSKFILFITVWNWNQDTINAQQSAACFTPNKRTGVCVPIYQCTELMNLIRRKGHSPATGQYVKNSKCRVRGSGQTSVCCPSIMDVEVCGLIDARLDVAIALKIIGGEKTQHGAYPWMVALGYRKSESSSEPTSWFCGGALISSRYVLTAGHCIAGTGKWKLYKIRLGVIDLSDEIKESAKTVDIPIEETVVHEKFASNGPNIENDIALVRLEREVSYNEYIKPICLPRHSQFRARSMNNEPVYIAGWGVTNFGSGSHSPSLLHAEISTVDLEYCKEAYRETNAIVDDRNVCAGHPEGRKDTCQGDSGAPLMWRNQTDGKYYALGVVSFGRKCGEKGVPGVYTKVSEFTDFIDSNIY